MFFVFFFKQKTAYDMRISDWSSDVCSSDLVEDAALRLARHLRGEVPKPRSWMNEMAAIVSSRGEAVSSLEQPPEFRINEAGVGVAEGDRKSVVRGKRVSVRVDLGVRRILKKKTKTATSRNNSKHKIN